MVQKSKACEIKVRNILDEYEQK